MLELLKDLMGLHEGKEEILALAYYPGASAIGRGDRLRAGFGGGAFYLHALLGKL